MIKLLNVSKNFDSHVALKNVSIDFNPYETTVIIGPSGSGKSTVLRCINHLETPTSGQIFLKGQKLTARNYHRLCLKVGMVFQGFHLFSHMNVRDNLIYGPINVLKMKNALAKDKAMELLQIFGLKEKFLAMPNNLSGGQKQRIAICRALIMDPEVMLFDEPTSALDPEIIKDVINAIALLKDKMTIIIVTHHVKFAKAIADRVLFMDHGQILANQKSTEFFNNPTSYRAKLFLDNIGDFM